jgi:hypothetical protein
MSRANGAFSLIISCKLSPGIATLISLGKIRSAATSAVLMKHWGLNPLTNDFLLPPSSSFNKYTLASKQLPVLIEPGFAMT